MRKWMMGLPLLWLASACGSKADDDKCPVVEPVESFAAPPPQSPPHVWSQELLDGIPTAWWEVEFKPGATKTNHQLNLPKDAALGFDPVDWNRRDGWSPNMPIVVLPPKPVDPKSLHDETNPTDAADAAVVMVDADTGQRIRHFEELDQNATDPARQALIVRAWTPVQEQRTIVVAITDKLLGTDGKPMPPPPVVAKLLAGGLVCDSAAGDYVAAFAKNVEVLAKAGVAKNHIVSVWHYHTASSDWTHGPALQARDQLLAAVGEGGLGVTITQVEVDPAFAPSFTDLPPDDPTVKVAPMHGDLALRVRGKFETPLFLTSDQQNGTLNWVGPGPAIKQNGTTWREFVMLVPRKLAMAGGNGRLLLYGHGLLRGACVEGCVKPGDAEFMPHLAEDAGAVVVGTDWWGLSQPDIAVAVQLPSDFRKVPWLTDKLVQAAVQPIALTRVVRAQLLSHKWLQLNGKPLVDPASELNYYGNSLGGIMGTTAVSLHPDVHRAVMNVAGAVWSTLMNRSSDFAPFLDIFDGTQPDKFRQQLLFALMQSMWDLADPANFADHVLHEPFAGAPSNRQALWPVSWGDAQVCNLASGTLNRIAQVPVLTPALEAWFGSLTETALPAPKSAAVQWDSKHGVYPPGNGRREQDNDAHVSSRWMPEYQQMVVRFLFQDGQIEPRYCLGRDTDGKLPCDLPESTPKSEAAMKPPIATPVPDYKP